MTPRRFAIVFFLLILFVWIGWRVVSKNPESATTHPTAELFDRPLRFTQVQAAASVNSPASEEDAQQGVSNAAGAPQSLPFRVLSCTPGETILAFELPGYSVEKLSDDDGNEWSRVSIPGAEVRDVAGAPSLPWYPLSYGSRPGAHVVAEVRDLVIEELPSCRPLPGVGPVFYGQQPDPPVPSSALYDLSGKAYPAAWIVSDGTYQIRDIQGSRVAFSPARYFPSENTVRIVKRCTIALRSDDAAAVQLDAQTDFAAIQRRAFVNAPSFGSATENAVGALAILVPDDWRNSSALSDFVSWKRGNGWCVTVGAYPSETGSTPAELRDWVQARHASGAATHLLIAGDYAAIPPWQHSGARLINPTKEDVATDAHYAMIDGSGDLAYPDLCLGRLPVHTAASFDNALSRLIAYERGSFSDPGWTQRGVFLGSGQRSNSWPYNGTDSIDRVLIYGHEQSLQNAGILTSGSDFFDTSSTTSLECPDEVSAALDQGAGVLMYLGHGSCTAFKTTKFSTTQALALSNGEMQSFVMAPVCLTGNLDHATIYDVQNHGTTSPAIGDLSLGQAFFEAQDGVSGVAGAVQASNQTYWDPPIRMLERFATELLASRSENRLATQGAYFVSANNDAIDFCENYNAEFQAQLSTGGTSPGANGGYDHTAALYQSWVMEFLGDPSAVMRIGAQIPLTVSADIAGSLLTVHVTGLDAEEPQPIAGCAVALEVSDGTVRSLRTSAEGIATISLQGLPSGGGRLRVLDGSAPWRESWISWVDADGNRKISNEELLEWLAWWEREYDAERADAAELLALRDEALRQWRDAPDRPDASEELPAAPTTTSFPERRYEMVLEREDGLIEALTQNGIPVKAVTDSTVTILASSAEFSWPDLNGYWVESSREIVPTPPTPSSAEIRARLSALAHDHWPIARTILLGDSGRGKAIEALRISFADEEESASLPGLLLSAGLHGDEPEAVRQLLEFLDEVESALQGGDATLETLLRQCVLWVVPLWNPDGYDDGIRENANGVDLLRGFPTNAGALSLGDRIGLAAPWRYPSVFGETTIPVQPEQAAMVTWLAAHAEICASLRLCEGDGMLFTTTSAVPEQQLAQAMTAAADAGQGGALAIAPLAQRVPADDLPECWQADFLAETAMVAALPASSTATSLLRAWIAKAIELFPGTTVTSNPARRYIPGVPQHLELTIVPESTRVALRLELPDDWTAGIAGAEFSRGDDGFRDAILATTLGTETRLSLTIRPPSEEPPPEARIRLELRNGTQCTTTTQLLLRAPTENARLSFMRGWNLFSVPIAGTTPADWGFSACIPEPIDGFLQPAVGYWGLRERDGEAEVAGWAVEPPVFPVSTGLTLHGTTRAYRLPPGEAGYLLRDGAWRILPENAELPPGRAFWLGRR